MEVARETGQVEYIGRMSNDDVGWELDVVARGNRK